MASNGSARSGSGGRAVANRGGRARRPSKRERRDAIGERLGDGVRGDSRRADEPARAVGVERAAHRLLPPDGADPPLRGEDRRDVHPGQDRRLLPPQPRRRGHHRRRDVGARSRATTSSRTTASTATSSARGIDPNRVMAELFGKETGVSRGPRRLDAPVRRRGPLHGRLRHRRRAVAAGDGRRAGHLPQGHRRGRGLPDGRRHHQHRRLARVAEHRPALEAAGDLPDRQQPVRHGHQRREGLGGAGAVQEGLRLRHARRAGGRQRRAGRARRDAAGRRAGPRGEAADRAGDDQLPPARPLGGRSGPLPPARCRAGARAGPDPGTSDGRCSRPS